MAREIPSPALLGGGGGGGNGANGNLTSILLNDTITSNDSIIYEAGSASEVTLIYNVAGPFIEESGIVFRMVQVDPEDEVSEVGEAVLSEFIQIPTIGTLKLPITGSPFVLVSWDISGPSVGGVTASVFGQSIQNNQTVRIADTDGNIYSSVFQNNNRTLVVESRQLESLLSSILTELQFMRKQLVSITGEEDPL